MPLVRRLAAALLATTLAPALAIAQAAVGEQDLRRFAEATAKIRIIDREYTKKKDGKPPAERAQLDAEEQKEYHAAVAATGLSPAQYNAISKAIQDDPALAQKAYEYIHAVRVR